MTVCFTREQSSQVQSLTRSHEMNEQEEKEIHESIEDAIQEIPPPFRIFFKLGHRITLSFRKRKWKKWRKAKALAQSAGRAAKASSDATEKREKEKRKS